MAGTKYLKDRELKRLRAIMVIQDRVHGLSIQQIAQKYNISTDTVERDLQFARKEDLIRDQEMKLLEDLVPKAMNAITMALEDGDAQVALEILKGTNILKKQKDPNKTTIQSSTEGDDDWSNLLNGLSGSAGVIEGTIAGEPAGFLPASSQQTATEKVAPPADSGQSPLGDSTESGEKNQSSDGQNRVSPLEVIANLRSRAEI